MSGILIEMGVHMPISTKLVVMMAKEAYSVFETDDPLNDNRRGHENKKRKRSRKKR